MKWNMYAHKNHGIFVHVVSNRETMSFYGNGEIHSVLVSEVEQDMTHWAWLDANHPTGPPRMIWPTLTQLNMCFPYGVDAEIARGYGRIITLVVTLN